MLESRFDDIARLSTRADELAARAVERDGTVLERLRSTLRALSPQSTLDRGYAVVQNAAGGVVRDAAAVGATDSLLVTLAAGTLDVAVQQANPA